jgi:hypothetical protein
MSRLCIQPVSTDFAWVSKIESKSGALVQIGTRLALVKILLPQVPMFSDESSAWSCRLVSPLLALKFRTARGVVFTTVFSKGGTGSLLTVPGSESNFARCDSRAPAQKPVRREALQKKIEEVTMNANDTLGTAATAEPDTPGRLDWDVKEFLDRLHGDQELFRELLQMFRTMPRQT